jgi:hypothetical protein
MSERKINKPLIRRMIKRIEAKPKGYDQGAFYAEASKAAPCGTVACLAGEAAICSKRTEVAGLKFALRLDYNPHLLIGCCKSLNCHIFDWNASGWPAPHNTEYANAKTYKARARAAANFLRAILKTDGKILESA